MATFGKTTATDVGRSQGDLIKRACRFTLIEEADVQSISVFLGLIEPAPTGVKVAIYADVDSKPDVSPLVMAELADAGYGVFYRVVTAVGRLPPADYWLAWKTQANGWSEGRYNQQAGATKQCISAVEGYNDSWGGWTNRPDYQDWECGIYATYTPAGAILHTITLDSTPTGVTYVQPPGTAPFTVQVEDGGALVIEVPSFTEIGGTRYHFEHFSVDGETYTSNRIEITNITTAFTIMVIYKESLPEETIAETSFDGGTIDPFRYWGSGDYTLFGPSTDPLNTGEYGVIIRNGKESYSRGSLTFDLPYTCSPLTMRMVVAFRELPHSIIHTPWISYEHGIASIWVNADGFTVYYGDGGEEKKASGAMMLEVGKKYEVMLVAYLGDGNGEIYLYASEYGQNLREIIHISNINNLYLALQRFLEFGMQWDAPDGEEYVYYLQLVGAKLSTISLSGQVVDSTSQQGVPYAGVRIGFLALDKWGITETTADELGNFTLDVPEGTYDIKVIALGYGNLVPGSITYFQNESLTAGMPPLQLPVDPQTQIQPADLRPSHYVWECRAVTLFPWTFGGYNDPRFGECLDEIKVKMPHINTIEIRLYLIGHSDGTVNFCDAWGSEGNALSYNDMTARGINLCHEKGFKVFVGIVFLVEEGFTMPGDPTDFFTNHEQRIVSYCKFLNGELVSEVSSVPLTKAVEFTSLTFEPRVVNFFRYDSYLQTLFPSVRAVYGGKVGFHHLGINYSPNDSRSGTWWHDADFVFGFGWWRLTGELDPTEGKLKDGWLAPPDWCYSPDPASPWRDTCKIFRNPMEFIQAFSTAKSPSLPKDIPAIINTGFPTNDGCNKSPYGGISSVNDFEEQALCFKVFFDTFKDIPNILGLDAERHGDPYDPSATTGSFRGTLAEQFIEKGFKAVSQPLPPPKPPIIPLILFGVVLGYLARKG